MDTLAVQFPSRAFAHIAPPWAQALHSWPAQGVQFRPSHPSDDLMLTERDLDLPVPGRAAEDTDPHGLAQRGR